MRNRIDQARRDEALRLVFEEKLKPSAAAARIGVSLTAVRVWIMAYAEANGIKDPPVRLSVPEEKKDKAVEFVLRRGAKAIVVERVAEALEVKPSTVRSWIAARRGVASMVRGK